MIGVGGAPPRPREFEPFLDDVTVRAFDFSRTDRQIVGQRAGVVELILAADQIAVARTHGRFAIRHGIGLTVRPQGFEDFGAMTRFETFFLLREPHLGQLSSIRVAAKSCCACDSVTRRIVLSARMIP